MKKLFNFLLGILLSASILHSADSEIEIVGKFGGGMTSIAVDGEYSYIMNGLNLEIYNTSNKDNITLLGTYEASTILSSIKVKGDYLYAVENANIIL